MDPKGQPVSADDLMTSADAARVLGLSADMVRLLARTGRLVVAARSVGGVRLFRRSDVDELAEKRRQSKELENGDRDRSGGHQ
jgi:excisionase family DNA binding protein